MVVRTLSFYESDTWNHTFGYFEELPTTSHIPKGTRTIPVHIHTFLGAWVGLGMIVRTLSFYESDTWSDTLFGYFWALPMTIAQCLASHLRDPGKSYMVFSLVFQASTGKKLRAWVVLAACSFIRTVRVYWSFIGFIKMGIFWFEYPNA